MPRKKKRRMGGNMQMLDICFCCGSELTSTKKVERRLTGSRVCQACLDGKHPPKCPLVDTTAKMPKFIGNLWCTKCNEASKLDVVFQRLTAFEAMDVVQDYNLGVGKGKENICGKCGEKGAIRAMLWTAVGREEMVRKVFKSGHTHTEDYTHEYDDIMGGYDYKTKDKEKIAVAIEGFAYPWIA